MSTTTTTGVAPEPMLLEVDDLVQIEAQDILKSSVFDPVH